MASLIARGKPIYVRGVHRQRMAAFAEKYRGWHTYAADRATRRAAAGLAKLGVIEIDERLKMFRWPALAFFGDQREGGA
jgi:hypothetical protein